MSWRVGNLESSLHDRRRSNVEHITIIPRLSINERIVWRKERKRQCLEQFCGGLIFGKSKELIDLRQK